MSIKLTIKVTPFLSKKHLLEETKRMTKMVEVPAKNPKP
jgi:hypothetical protein